MRQIRVLVVDDQPVYREGLVSIITSQSDLKLVGQARDGLEAVATAKQEKPDVILLDLNMPKQDGLTTIPQLRMTVPGARILVLTGFADAEIVTRAIDAGANGYLIKDLPFDQLLQAIRNVDQGQTYLEPTVAFNIIRKITAKQSATKDEGLTEREKQVLVLIARGLSNSDIAQTLFLNERTVAKYVHNILSKLQLANRTQAALYAVREGLDKAKEVAGILNFANQPPVDTAGRGN